MPAFSHPRVSRRYHFGIPGLIYVGITLFIAVGAFNSQNNLLFWTFGLALGLLVVSGIISGSMLMGIHVHREFISQAAVGDPLLIRYRVSNRNRVFPLFAITIDELSTSPRHVPTFLSRIFGKHHHRHPPRTEPARAFATHVGPRESVFAHASPVALRRGPVHLSTIRISSSFPFGLIRKSVTFTQRSTALIHPKPTHVERVPVTPAGGFGSDVRSARPGEGDEFHSLREFREGDALRSIAWRASARRGRMLVKQFVASSPARLLIELDLARAPEREHDDELAISSAAGLALAATRTGIAVAVQESGAGFIVPMGAGPAQAGRVLDELALIDLSRPRVAALAPDLASPGLTRLTIRAGESVPSTTAPPAAEGAA
jgi:uncharacterized protein (DUF58 family)